VARTRAWRLPRWAPRQVSQRALRRALRRDDRCADVDVNGDDTNAIVCKLYRLLVWERTTGSNPVIDFIPQVCMSQILFILALQRGSKHIFSKKHFPVGVHSPACNST
jgi:hypothetical protein